MAKYTENDKKQNLFDALGEFKKDPTVIGKTADNPFFSSKYVPLDKLLLTIQPKLNEYGLVLTQFPSSVDGKPSLKTILSHPESGETISENAVLVLVKQDPQAQGSAITYMRRYSIESILGIVTTKDDDANQATFKVVDGPTKEELLIVKNEIRSVLDIEQQGVLKGWMKENGITLKHGDTSSEDIQKLYEQISIIKEPIED